MNVIEQIQQILKNIQDVFSEDFSSEKLNELKLKYDEIIKEYSELSEISFENENKEKIESSLNKIFKDLEKNENSDDYGDTSYYLDNSFKNIKYVKENSRVINLKRDYLEGIIVMPDFQRKYVWSKKQVVELIVSFLLNIPIPTLYAYSEFDNEELTEKIYIIDGQQRLTSILFYFYGVFPKSLKNRKKYDFNLFRLCEKRNDIKNKLKTEENLELIKEMKKELEGIEKKIKLDYDIQLDVKFQTRIEENNEIKIKDLSLETLEVSEPRFRNIILTTPLEITMLKDFETIENLSRIFNIYNSKGKPLTEDEIRKSLYNKNYLYKKLGEYCLEVEANEHENSSFSKFNSTDTIASEKKLFQLLAYYFNLTMQYDKNTKWYKEDFEKISNYLNNKEIKKDEKEIIKGTLDSSYKGKKIEDLITEYSKYMAKAKQEILEKEFETIEKFFELDFKKENISNKKKRKYSFKNLICNYIIVRHFNLFENNIIIDEDMLSCTVRYTNTLEIGRLKAVYDLYVKRGYIHE